MTKYQNKYCTKSSRLKYWDYSSPGLYFDTICTKDMIPWFWKIESCKIKLFNIGNIAEQYWLEIPSRFDNVELGGFIIMPNHIHGIKVGPPLYNNSIFTWQPRF